MRAHRGLRTASSHPEQPSRRGSCRVGTAHRPGIGKRCPPYKTPLHSPILPKPPHPVENRPLHAAPNEPIGHLGLIMFVIVRLHEHHFTSGRGWPRLGGTGGLSTSVRASRTTGGQATSATRFPIDPVENRPLHAAPNEPIGHLRLIMFVIVRLHERHFTSGRGWPRLGGTGGLSTSVRASRTTGGQATSATRRPLHAAPNEPIGHLGLMMFVIVRLHERHSTSGRRSPPGTTGGQATSATRRFF